MKCIYKTRHGGCAGGDKPVGRDDSPIDIVAEEAVDQRIETIGAPLGLGSEGVRGAQRRMVVGTV